MTIRGRVQNGVVVPDDPAALPEGAEVRIELISSATPPRTWRQGGLWKGQVHIGADFDELPSDLAEAFGVRPS